MAARLGRHVQPPLTTLVARLLALCTAIYLACAQSPATNMPVPPLQWLNLNGLTQGSPPPPLKDSSIGYDENTRTLIIFGGESQAGVPQQGTYLLNLDSMSWSTPSTKVSTQTSKPPPRSRALGAGDFAANSRRDFVIFGGKGASNTALNDIWAYDFLNQFWVNVPPSGPSPPPPRWGTYGGIDPTVVPGSGNNVSTTLWIAGGSDSSQSFPSSELWQLVLTGTLASDVNSVQGLWQNKSLAPSLPGKTEAGGALVSATQASNAHIVVSGGCGPNVLPINANTACVDTLTFVLTIPSDRSSGGSISPAQCPAPRLGPAIVPNLNPSLSSFTSQAFMLLGTFNSSEWNDSGGLSKGEVAVLDVDAGTWARVLPSGDPGSSGTPTFPSPRQGAAALSFPSALAGVNRQSASDIVVFGGQDDQGNYLNDLWLLRTYNGSITKSGDKWAGFGSGTLGTGTSASGAGVSVQYLTQCAQQLKPTVTSSSSTTSNTGTGQPGHTGAPTPTPIAAVFDASVLHKSLSPVSIAAALAATLIARWSSPAASQSSPDRYLALIYLAIPLGIAAYAVGVAGFATSLTSTVRASSTLQRRSGIATGTLLKTAHGEAGFALFIGLYGIVPLFGLLLWWARRERRVTSDSSEDDDAHQKEPEDVAMTGEKDLSSTRRAVSPARSAPDVPSNDPSNESSMRDRRRRAQSGPGLFPGWRGQETSEQSEAGPSVSTKGFEVTNRPRRASGGMALHHPRDPFQRRTDMGRSLSDISWLDRRRSVSAVGELDYALSQLDHGASPRSISPPPTSRPPTFTMSNRPFVRTPSPQPASPLRLDVWDVVLHTLFHTFLLANCILALVALFSRAPIATFAVFLVWTLASYTALFILAWNGRPRRSILVNILATFRAPSSHVIAPSTSPVLGSGTDEHVGSPFFPVATPGGSPYIYHQPPWRRAVSPEEDRATRTSHGGLHTVETDEPEDDEDDDDRQRHMEEELMRRDVNIVTVPRRKLWITNPGS